MRSALIAASAARSRDAQGP